MCPHLSALFLDLSTLSQLASLPVPIGRATSRNSPVQHIQLRPACTGLCAHHDARILSRIPRALWSLSSGWTEFGHFQAQKTQSFSCEILLGSTGTVSARRDAHLWPCAAGEPTLWTALFPVYPLQRPTERLPVQHVGTGRAETENPHSILLLFCVGSDSRHCCDAPLCGAIQRETLLALATVAKFDSTQSTLVEGQLPVPAVPVQFSDEIERETEDRLHLCELWSHYDGRFCKGNCCRLFFCLRC